MRVYIYIYIYIYCFVDFFVVFCLIGRDPPPEGRTAQGGRQEVNK